MNLQLLVISELVMKRTALYIFWFITAVLVEAQERNEDGFLNLLDGCTLAPWIHTCIYSSKNFPRQAPHLLNQKGRYACHNAPEEKTSIMLVCPTIDIPKSADGSCESQLTMVDLKTRKSTAYCGKYENLTIVSESQDILIQLITTKQGGGLVNCTVKCVWLGSGGEVEYPTPHPYLTHEFEEEDSSEDGTYPGEVSTTCPCGLANKMTSRIVNGTVASRNEFPFIAALVEAKSLWQFCGAPIITPYHTLTAAHCTRDYVKIKRKLAVIVGAHDLSETPDPSNIIKVKKIIQHEGYNRQEHNAHDISLLLLERKIQFSPLISRVCLPTHQLNLAHKQVKVIGWGATEFGGPGSTVLRKLNMRVLKMEECALAWGIPIENPIHMCTYRTYKSSCQGDSGGPVVWLDPETNRYTLAGIVSFGFVCGDETPRFQTDVGAHLPWIYKNIASSKLSEACTKSS